MNEATFLEELCEATDKELCPTCKCCEVVWESCETCAGNGYIDNDDYDEMNEWENDSAPCEMCDGKGGHKMCIGRCDENGKHTKHN